MLTQEVKQNLLQIKNTAKALRDDYRSRPEAKKDLSLVKVNREHLNRLMALIDLYESRWSSFG